MFDNNQPTMVRESQMAVQDQQVSARQLREMDVNAIVSTSKKKSRQQPPPASRHRSVLTLDCVVPLFDMRATTSINIVDIIRSSREARPIQNMTTITTDRMSPVEDPMYAELLVSFYSPPEEDSNNFIKNTFKVIMPRTWTPKMYVGALHHSIRRNLLLTLESIKVSGRNYTTINELNQLFPIQKEIINRRLVTSGSYLNLNGGELQNKIP